MVFNPSLFTPVINHYLPEPHASLLNGIIFGIPLKTSKTFYDQLKMVGLIHMVVLSGTNITILSAIIASITSRFSKRISILITILIIIIFVIFVGPQAPVIRAAIMGILTLVAILYGRKTYALYSLLLSFIIIAIFWPQWISTLSLQLSFGATLGIILFGKITPKNGSGLSASVKNAVMKEITPSLAAQIFTVPIIAFSFKQISVISPVSNLLVSFIVPPLMVFGFLAAILGKIHFILGFIPAYICYGLLHYIVIVVDVLSKIPYGFIQIK